MSKMGWAAVVLVAISAAITAVAVGAVVMVWGILIEAARTVDEALK